ncbi:superoxide dismutase family protein [Salegentibacter mishustinae]|uniref:superoxide dismutase family protein n=1 Tax=Salegentibacter mishustinae TaxID=270918 RepID=UPI001CE07DBB|nr:superoxide dismutase family protein [Salegentibacter mishustinae]UBZ06006.1 superoxide dismutase family protein [Salegentibacter mishustinae]
MKRISLSLVFCASLFIIGCKNDKKENDTENAAETEMNSEMDNSMEKEEETKEITVSLEPKSGSDLGGEVTFTQEAGEVTMEATITGLAEGQHAIHIHQKADCSAEDGTSAGGHWNPTNEKHGKWGDAEGYHKGDIGNFEVDANGEGTVSMTTDEWCIGCDDENKNIVGKAIIVHDGVDDYTSQPSGAAGTRVGCGVIKM